MTEQLGTGLSTESGPQRDGLFGGRTHGIGCVIHCPGCGSRSIDLGPGLEGPVENPVFDIACHFCGWTGDVSPDRPISKVGPNG